MNDRGWQRTALNRKRDLPRGEILVNKSDNSRFSPKREEYRRFLQQPSGNLDDTGFFSVQVISRALALWNLELIPLYSSDDEARRSRDDPTLVRAFIFNQESHWFCIRRFGTERNGPVTFFNLNSLFSKPEFMSSFYLTEYLNQMKQEGYSIFVVGGELPECPADQKPPVQVRRPANQNITKIIDLTKSESTASMDEDLQKAIQLSLERPGAAPGDAPASTSSIGRRLGSTSETSGPSTATDSDSELESALRLSMECFERADAETAGNATPLEIRDRRLAYFQSKSSSSQDK